MLDYLTNNFHHHCLHRVLYTIHLHFFLRTLGATHKETLRTANNYSELLFRQGKFKDAEKLALRAAKDREISESPSIDC
jgi:hypothetical protein